MRTLLLALLLSTATAVAQSQNSPAAFAAVPPISFETAGPVLRADAQPQKPFTVAGEHGALLGRQDGSLEAWVLPVKLFSGLTIEAEIAGYPVAIDVNQTAASIEVRPERTVIAYSHDGFTVRQIMFSPTVKSVAGVGPVILYQFDCLHPTDFTFRFTPNLEWMWPARNAGVPGVEWDAARSLYVLHTDYPDLAGAVTIPGAEPGMRTPYQDRPQVHAVELRLHIDPVRGKGKLFPLLMAVGTDPDAASNAALAATIAKLNAAIPAAYAEHRKRFDDLLAKSVSIDTPDKSLDEAFQWAVVSIEQLRTKAFRPAGSASATATDGTAEETALVAGYFNSADTARPGFGWFFGRDALYALYAVNGFGDFALTRDELDFLIRRQRDDGKIMHEYSQTAALVNWWPGFPYMYAAADSTPLFLMAVADYVRSSGDTAYLGERRAAIEKAWAFETDPAHDTDGDGIYDNSQGTGWVESWPGGMPHQEIYLALLDQQASTAYAYIEDQLHDAAKAGAARARASHIAKTINANYHDREKGCYAFATNPANTPNGPVDRTTTVYPAMAWWDPQQAAPLLDDPEPCLRNFIASGLNTDWGTRDIANNEKFYDGMSYHQGSVWPLFTGWAAMAEYRGNQPLAGYQLLKENANLTTAQDVGSLTEVISGDFFVPFGRSTSHQLWSSAMVITPTLRGLFGISVDATSKTITANPHLPANWDHAEIRNLHIGDQSVGLNFARSRGIVTVSLEGAAGIRLATSENETKRRSDGQIAISDHPVQISTVVQVPEPGNRTEFARVVNESYGDHKLTLSIEGLTGTEAQFPLAISSPGLRVQAVNGELVKEPSSLLVHFPTGSGWQMMTVTLTW